tara:strand:+ start:442 stop:879 length:438 start_codon:yes stop_codon:yes gene_type:complete
MVKNKIIKLINNSNKVNLDYKISSFSIKLKNENYFYSSKNNINELTIYNIQRLFIQRDYWEVNKDVKKLLPNEINFYASLMINNFDKNYSIIKVSKPLLSNNLKNIKINNKFTTEFEPFEIITTQKSFYIKSEDFTKSIDLLKNL